MAMMKFLCAEDSLLHITPQRTGERPLSTAERCGPVGIQSQYRGIKLPPFGSRRVPPLTRLVGVI